MSTIPILINPKGGSAEKVLEVLRADSRFAVHEVEPGELAARIEQLARGGATRIAVSGGDGTITAAAAVLAGTKCELAVIPGGTLNHFAHDNGIPVEPKEAAELAATGTPHPIDVAHVNERLFLNTSSVGAYVSFVRTRERLERRMWYWPASTIAGLQMLFRMPSFDVHIDAAEPEESKSYRACLVFISVGERDFERGTFGRRTAHGHHALHVIVVPNGGPRQLLGIVFAAVFRGMQATLHEVDSFLVDHCRIEMRRPKGNVSYDGELEQMTAPLEYRYQRDALLLVSPPPDERETAA
ncbi:MAG: diacylglycerol/lipid kinase family protein [Gemmatimonadaceae bacterium]